ncbi:hypothetical protein RCL_jg8348.t1 [Rhizophagus clarus]|uniref:Uncharacterized protein n=1 Tax=Rhizophagus clarus TaxID=94130 RepID=A0A8H3R4J8_9GLOM|nr:hypothetical protein RCL_jg8348.t1 [Rhizophagus clarus]
MKFSSKNVLLLLIFLICNSKYQRKEFRNSSLAPRSGSGAAAVAGVTLLQWLAGLIKQRREDKDNIVEKRLVQNIFDMLRDNSMYYPISN